MATDPQNEKSGLEHTAQAAGAVKGAIKAGKALAGASKGAAFGPYGIRQQQTESDCRGAYMHCGLAAEYWDR